MPDGCVSQNTEVFLYPPTFSALPCIIHPNWQANCISAVSLERASPMCRHKRKAHFNPFFFFFYNSFFSLPPSPVFFMNRACSSSMFTCRTLSWNEQRMMMHMLNSSGTQEGMTFYFLFYFFLIFTLFHFQMAVVVLFLLTDWGCSCGTGGGNLCKEKKFHRWLQRGNLCLHLSFFFFLNQSTLFFQSPHGWTTVPLYYLHARCTTSRLLMGRTGWIRCYSVTGFTGPISHYFTRWSLVGRSGITRTVHNLLQRANQSSESEI